MNKLDHASMTFRHKAVLLHNAGIPIPIQRCLAVVLVILFSPLMLIMYGLIKADSEGPVIFSQIRVGRLGERFKLYKFRSMYVDSDPRFKRPSDDDCLRPGVCKKFINDPRITPLGRVIRKLSIDELPQLLNVVKGEMLLIGPRPALPKEVDGYPLRDYRRLEALPGLTGLWQVCGRANTNFEQQLALDIEYLERQSIALDIKILLLTIPAVLTGDGAY
jgi:lipopolysaccharide/colanic/teichoic acid biosynthesis glycosyltransferase